MTRCVPAGLRFAEVPGPTGAFSHHFDPNTDQSCAVGIHHVGKIGDLQVVGAGALAVEILVQALVYANHCNVDTDLFLDLEGGDERKRERMAKKILGKWGC